MGVERLGHRKIVMQAIRVLFDQGAAGGKPVTLDAASGRRYQVPSDASSALEEQSGAEVENLSAQEKSGTV